MTYQNVLSVEYAVVFDGTDYHPLGKKTARQVKRYLDGLEGAKGVLTVCARGVVEITGEWVEVPVDGSNYPAIPDIEALGLGVHRHVEHAPLVPEEAEPVVPVLTAKKTVRPPSKALAE
jgi:hypothetical protein